jgi:ATP-dependent helicase HrpB
VKPQACGDCAKRRSLTRDCSARRTIFDPLSSVFYLPSLFNAVPLAPLPIDDVLPQLIAALSSQSNVVLQAPTGSGKTTRVAPAILDAGLAGEGAIVMLEPRRVAARAAARRIAFERGGAVGGEVGYSVRFDQRISRDTRLRIVTDGVLLRNLQDDPFLERVAVVVFDEFHERGINVDLALGMARRIQQTVRPDLKIVVMSATLAAEPVADFLGDCRTVVAEGKQFPVELAYLGGKNSTTGFTAPRGDSMHSAGGRFNPLFEHRGIETVVRAITAVVDQTEGDVLVFLPGVGEIRRFQKELAILASQRNLAVMPLYGDLPAEQQDAVLGPCGRRKVVLATNVAETSITIDGVTAVVDTGLARMLRFDEHVGLDKLVLGRISKASAAQRAGRAGRTQPGVALRLWTCEEQRGLPDQDEPEIRRVDLAGPVLQLHAWGETNVAWFPWFEPPRELSLAQADRLLTRLGALEAGSITELGRVMSRLPAHPRIARLLIEGNDLGVPQRAAMAAALLSERNPFQLRSEGGLRREATHRSESDVVDRVTQLEEFERLGGRVAVSDMINVGAARFVLRTKDQFLELLEQISRRTAAPTGGPASTSADEALQRALLAAFPDRVARRREMSDRRGVMVGGRGVRLAVESAVTASELFICVDVDAGTTEALARMASAVDRSWLDRRLLEIRDDVTFDPRSSRVVALRRTCWDDLVLDEVSLGHIPDDKLAAALAKAAAEDLTRVFPKERDICDFVERAKALREWMPELGLPALDESQLAGLLPGLCQNCRSFDDLRRAPWLQWIKSLFTPAQLQAIEREAPEKLAVPSGNRVAIQYKAGKRPVLAVRIQELFGLAETPRIAGGRVPLLMHLLAPNMRPQQVTDDLKSFWNSTYQQVRKDLRARYPKHAWPDDPWNAPPQRKPGKKS